MAEIEVAHATLVSAFTQVLKEAGYSLSSSALSRGHSVLATNIRASIPRLLLKSRPERLQLSIESVSPYRCRLTIDYSLSFGMKCRLYCLLAELAILNAVGIALFVNPPPSLVAKVIAGQVWSLVLAYGIPLGATLAILTMLRMFSSLLTKFDVWHRSFLRAALSMIEPVNHAIVYESLCTQNRSNLDKIFWVYGLFLLIFPWLLVKPTLLWLVLTDHPVILILAVTLLPLGILLRLNRSNLFLRSKLSPLTVNILLAFSVIWFLFYVPLLMYVASTHIVALMVRLPSLWWLPMVLIVGGYIYFSVLAFVHLLCACRTWEYFCGGTMSLHQKTLQSMYTLLNNKSRVTRDEDMTLSTASRMAVWCTFLLCSALCWTGVFLNTSILHSLVLPHYYPTNPSIGGTILRVTEELGGAALGLSWQQRESLAFRFFCVTPIVGPFLLLACLHVIYAIRSYRRAQGLVALKGHIVEMVAVVCRDLDVIGVQCVLDPRRGGISPYADFTGLVPKKRIVFGPRSVEFCEAFPEHAKAIIVHEVTHLKHDFTSLWLMPFFSRLGLVGAGFLSVLQNSLAMEDRADNEARAYLKKIEMNSELVGEAAQLLTFLSGATEDTGRYAAFLGPPGNMPQGLSPSREHGMLKSVIAHLRLGYELYFGTKMYDYLHRDARQRSARQFSQKKLLDIE